MLTPQTSLDSSEVKVLFFLARQISEKFVTAVLVYGHSEEALAMTERYAADLLNTITGPRSSHSALFKHEAKTIVSEMIKEMQLYIRSQLEQ